MLPRRKFDEEPIRDVEEAAGLPADSEPRSGMRRIEIVELGEDPIEVADCFDVHDNGRDTDVSEIHGALARLTDTSSRAVLAHGCAAYLELSTNEAHALALAATGARMEIVFALSPMSEAETMQFLARLVLSGVLRIE
jgi:hypothetical protein